MNTKQEQVKKLTAGRDNALVAWLSLEVWDELPTEDVMDAINEAWDEYGDDTEGFTRYVRHLMGDDTVTVSTVYDDLIHDEETRRRIISYDFEQGEDGFVRSLEDKYDVYSEVIKQAMHRVRDNWRRNF